VIQKLPTQKKDTAFMEMFEFLVICRIAMYINVLLILITYLSSMTYLEFCQIWQFLLLLLYSTKEDRDTYISY